MRRLSILFSIALVFALIVVAAATAAAPDFCDEGSPKYNPDHPNCSTTTTVTTTTEPSQLEACTTGMTITGNGQTSFQCLWTPDKVGDGDKVATVTVFNIEGGIKNPPVVFVRDDAPGDICLLEQEWENQDGPVYVAEFDLFYETVPPGYEAWDGHSYWDLKYASEYVPAPPIVGAYWCGPQDPVLETIRFDTNGTPLHFQVNFNARGGGQFEITLSPGQG
jgi:hypothetical protein